MDVLGKRMCNLFTNYNLCRSSQRELSECPVERCWEIMIVSSDFLEGSWLEDGLSQRKVRSHLPPEETELNLWIRSKEINNTNLGNAWFTCWKGLRVSQLSLGLAADSYHLLFMQNNRLRKRSTGRNSIKSGN